MRTTLLAALGLTVSAPAFAQTPEPRWPDTETCELSTAGGRISVTARCGTLEVPEDRADPDGRSIELAWAVVEARTGTPAPDPVVFLAGGPGQSARDSAPMISRALNDVNRTRDLVFLDQRGTGGSNALSCEFDASQPGMGANINEISRQLRICHDSLDAALEHYTTRAGADDLEALRQHLGFDLINLVGVSYGTRMAQVYLRRHPEAVRSTVIDGVVPMRLALGSEHAEKLDASIEKLLTRCVDDPTCNEQFPNLRQMFETLKARYADQPATITVTHPRTGVAEEITFDDTALADSLRFLAYSPVSQMAIPYLIHEAASTGSPERLAAQGVMTNEQVGAELAIGLNFSVGCAEDWPHWPQGRDESGTLLGNSFREIYQRVCDWWPAEPVGEDFHQPFDRESPILILSGELDPVTPPEYGVEANEQFSNSLHLVSPGRGHITLGNPCISGIVTEFIDAASIEDLETECMDAIGPEPFFLNLLGPSP